MGMTLESGHYRSTVDLQKQEALNKSILFQLELMVRILPDKSLLEVCVEVQCVSCVAVQGCARPVIRAQAALALPGSFK